MKRALIRSTRKTEETATTRLLGSLNRRNLILMLTIISGNIETFHSTVIRRINMLVEKAKVAIVGIQRELKAN